MDSNDLELFHRLWIVMVIEAMLKCLRIYSTSDGESHFDEVEIPAAARSIFGGKIPPFSVSDRYPASDVRFTHIPAGIREVGWHTVPARTLTIRLNGSVDYEASDGQVRHVPAGSIVLVEDTFGRGHLSRHSQEGQIVVWITLPAGFDLSAK